MVSATNKLVSPQKINSIRTNNSPLKIDGWDTILSFWESAYFPGAPYVCGQKSELCGIFVFLGDSDFFFAKSSHQKYNGKMLLTSGICTKQRKVGSFIHVIHKNKSICGCC